MIDSQYIYVKFNQVPLYFHNFKKNIYFEQTFRSTPIFLLGKNVKLRTP